MANLRETLYGRDFQQEKRTKDISTHGSPIVKEYWGTNQKDESIMEEMINKLAHTSRNGMGIPIHSGFDGTFQYSFHLYGCPTVEKGIGNNPDIYNRRYLITKAGDERDEGMLSDIEVFLMENKFKILDKNP